MEGGGTGWREVFISSRAIIEGVGVFLSSPSVKCCPGVLVSGCLGGSMTEAREGSGALSVFPTPGIILCLWSVQSRHAGTTVPPRPPTRGFI